MVATHHRTGTLNQYKCTSRVVAYGLAAVEASHKTRHEPDDQKS